MFGNRNSQPKGATGTSNSFFVPCKTDPTPINMESDYFIIKVHSAQAAFTGPLWEKAVRLIVTTQVNLNLPYMNEDIFSIQRTREIERDRTIKLGLCPNLVSLVPACMTHVSVAIDFIVDKKNQLASLQSLINDDNLLSILSLAPGSVLVAKSIGQVAKKIIQTFIPANEQQPILQFECDFNLVTENFKEGFYVVMGSSSPKSPLPVDPGMIEVRNGEVFIDQTLITNLSYVVLEVIRVPARGRTMSEDAEWEDMLREAEDLAEITGRERSMKVAEKKKAWEKCRSLLISAQALLRADRNYHPKDARAIITDAYTTCEKAILGSPEQRITKGGSNQMEEWSSDIDEDRQFLDIPTDIEATLDDYAERLYDAKSILDREK